MRDVFIFEARLLLSDYLRLGTFEVFVVRVSRKSSLNVGFECGCLCHATIAEFLEPSLWVVLMYDQKERGRLWGEVGAGYLPSESNEVKV